MNIHSALDGAMAGLQAAQQGLTLTAQNVGNANRPGYVRRSAASGAPEQTGANNGTQPLTLRNTDALLFEQLATVTGRDQYAQTLVQRTSTLNAMLGKADQSIAQALSQFLNAAGALANDASSSVLQGNLVSSAQVLMDRLVNFQSMVDTVRQQAQQGFADQLNQANTDLSQLAQINKAIEQGSNQGNATSVPDLLDQRDALILDLQKRIGGTASIQSNGTANYSLGGVQLVQGGTAYAFAQGSGSTTLGDVALSDVYIKTTGGASSADAMVRTQTTDASGQAVSLFQSGSVGADVELMQKFIPAMQARLNLVGASIAIQVNSTKRADGTLIAPVFGYANATGTTTLASDLANRAGYTDVSSTATFKQMLDALDPASASYSPAAVAKLSQNGIQISQMRLVLTTSSASVGTLDATAARAIEANRVSLGDPLAAINSQWAQKLSQWGQDKTLQSTLLKSVSDQYQSVAGVNLDEEAVQMQTYQRQYSAASKLMQTLNRMFDDLLGMMSR